MIKPYSEQMNAGGDNGIRNSRPRVTYIAILAQDSQSPQWTPIDLLPIRIVIGHFSSIDVVNRELLYDLNSIY